MKRMYRPIMFFILLLSAIVYDFQTPDVIDEETKISSYVVLEGEFLQLGKYEFEGEITMRNIVEDVGVTSKANLEALNLELMVIDESRIYLPAVQQDSVSLNRANQDELMTLAGVGEKTAQKIIAYRQQQAFTTIEDIMKVKGIGEKTYLRLRSFLCL